MFVISSQRNRVSKVVPFLYWCTKKKKSKRTCGNSRLPVRGLAAKMFKVWRLVCSAFHLCFIIIFFFTSLTIASYLSSCPSIDLWIVFLWLSLRLHVDPSIYLYLSLYICIHSTYQSLPISYILLISSSAYPSARVIIYLSSYLSTYQSAHQSLCNIACIFTAICQFLYVSTYLYLPIFAPIYLPISLSIYLCVLFFIQGSCHSTYHT